MLQIKDDICLFIWKSSCQFKHLTVYPALSVNPPICLCSISLFIHCLLFAASCLSVYTAIYLSNICVFIQHLSVYPASLSLSPTYVCLSSICLFIQHLSVYPASVCLYSICLSIHWSAFAASCWSVYTVHRIYNHPSVYLACVFNQHLSVYPVSYI